MTGKEWIENELHVKKIDKKMYSPNGGAKGVELADSASPVRANS